MKSHGWTSQPFPPEGASAAEGIRNQLGKPELDHLTILVRESAQNSWDARAGDEPVQYRINLTTVSAADAPAWRDHLLRKAPANKFLPLREALQQPTIRVMSISDRGTRGLGGPTRADQVTDQPRDFVAFLRNIGEPRDRTLGGGTYGFGKGILYLVSHCGTILVHTRCEYEGRYETRLMGAALWKSYDAHDATGERRYTGRHWWGDTSGDVIEPLVGQEADAMARRLGLREFGNHETGTTVIILNPNLEEREPAEAARYLAETITWQLWPKMLPHADEAVPMRFSVTCDGIEYPVPDPWSVVPLRPFVSAYKKMVGDDCQELRYGRAKMLLGRLGLHRTVAKRFDASHAAAVAGFEDGLVHHVCLMRQAELVVNYWRGPKPASEFAAYAGVFRADESMDATYAAAEPPTHDSWNPQTLDHPDSSYVRTTFTRLREAIDAVIGNGGRGELEVAQVSLGAASDRLSPLIGGAWGVGSATSYARPGDTSPPASRRRKARRPEPKRSIDDEIEGDEDRANDSSQGRSDGPTSGSSSRPTPSRKPRVEYVGEPEPEDLWGNAVVVQKFRLPVAVPQRVRAEVAVALASDGGIETDPPAGAENPGLVGWQDPCGELYQTPSFVIEGGNGQIWKAVVKPAPDTMTDIVLFTERVS
ncbi:hypothetical protein [Nocardia higoensis]|uniref:hypothetical protein n=1 Tax=Nocardia higoensis TaxID=228599 RepID=UPI0002E6F84E|nr:hypothetical protein [Nocardia higoensis]